MYMPRKMWPHTSSKSDSTDCTEALNNMDETQEDDVVGPGETGSLGTELLPSIPIHGSDANSFTATGGPADSTDKTPDQAQASQFDALFKEIQELRDDQDRIVIESLRFFNKNSYLAIKEALEEQLCRCDVLEEQLSNFAELFQNKVSILTEQLPRMKDKIANESCKGAADIDEALKAFHSLISNMEQEQQQQLNRWESTTGQTLLGKPFDVLLVVLVGFLAFVDTAINHLLPLIKTPGCMLSTVLFVVLFHFLWRHWDLILVFSLPSTS